MRPTPHSNRELPGQGRKSRLLADGPAQPVLLDADRLRFVVKRHRASRLHTDIRLEVYGQLISWASYPTPSHDPRTKIRLREVVDHDLRYLHAERRIPDGSDGAGPVVVWDRGLYRTLHGEGADERAVLAGLRRGRIDLWFEGERLRGGYRFAFEREGWTMAKLDDEYASASTEPWPDLSLLTGRSLDDLEREYQARRRASRLPVSTDSRCLV